MYPLTIWKRCSPLSTSSNYDYVFQRLLLIVMNDIWIVRFKLGNLHHLSLLASLSLYISSRTSPILTSPFTLRIKFLLSASLPEIRTTFTWVIPPLEPVLPNNCVTLALTGYVSMIIILSTNYYNLLILFKAKCQINQKIYRMDRQLISIRIFIRLFRSPRYPRYKADILSFHPKSMILHQICL